MKKLLLFSFVACFCSAANAQWGDALSYSNADNSYCHAGGVLSSQTANLTLECWVKLGTITGSSSSDIQIVYNGNSGPSGYGIYLHSGYLSILLGSVMEQVSSVPLQSDTWTHLALVADASDNWTLYANGVSVVTYADAPNTPSGDFSVGGNPYGNESFNGVIDEVRFSSVARYASDFTPQSTPFTTDAHTIALYHFDEGSGTTTADASGNGNTLTLINSPTWVVDDNPLPVETTAFLATADFGSVTLSWKTQSEVNNAGFNVLRQETGDRNKDQGTEDWQLVASYKSNKDLVGLGNSSTGQAYQFVDKKVQSGATYNYKLQSVSTNGTTTDLTTLSVTVDIPKNYALYQNYPNPFNPSTTIRFDLKQTSTVTLEIYNVLGQRVEYWNYGMKDAGRYNEAVNMAQCASGVYFYRIMADGNKGDRFVAFKKLMLVK